MSKLDKWAIFSALSIGFVFFLAIINNWWLLLVIGFLLWFAYIFVFLVDFRIK